MKRLVLIGFLTLAVISGASANIWDTREQINQRWGAPIEITGYPDERIYTYQVGQVGVRVSFLDGFSQYEHYRHLDKITPLSQTEVQEVLRNNSFGQEWEIDGDGYRLPDRSISAAMSQDSGGIQSLYLATAQYYARPDDPQHYVRTGKKRTFSGTVTLRQVDNSQWLVLHSDGYVLEVPWSIEGYRRAPAELTAGRTYTMTLLDLDGLDNYALEARLSDREHKNWHDAVDDSKSYLLAQIQDGERVMFDRSVCEIHHAQMPAKRVEVVYGLVGLTEANATCEREFPHHRDYILGGCLVGDDKTGLLFICPKCVAACAEYKRAHPEHTVRR